MKLISAYFLIVYPAPHRELCEKICPGTREYSAQSYFLFGVPYFLESFQWFNGSKDMANMVEVMVTDLHHSQAYQLGLSADFNFQPTQTHLTRWHVGYRPAPPYRQPPPPPSQYRSRALNRIERWTSSSCKYNAMPQCSDYTRIEFHDYEPCNQVRGALALLTLSWTSFDLACVQSSQPFTQRVFISHQLVRIPFVRILRKRCKMQCVFRMQSR